MSNRIAITVEDAIVEWQAITAYYSASEWGRVARWVVANRFHTDVVIVDIVRDEYEDDELTGPEPAEYETHDFWPLRVWKERCSSSGSRDLADSPITMYMSDDALIHFKLSHSLRVVC